MVGTLAAPGRSAPVVPRAAWPWLVAYLLVAVGGRVAELTDWLPGSFLGLAVAVPLLIGALLAGGLRRRRIGRWLLAGLVFSWLGDVLGWFILVKIGFFLVAQLGYAVAFWPYRHRLRRPWPVIISYALAVAALLVAVGRSAGVLLPAVLGYGLAVGSMAVLAAGVGRVAGLGGAVFLASDALIGLSAFPTGVRIPGYEMLIMITYLAAQLLLLLGAWQAVARDPDPPRHG